MAPCSALAICNRAGPAGRRCSWFVRNSSGPHSIKAYLRQGDFGPKRETTTSVHNGPRRFFSGHRPGSPSRPDHPSARFRKSRYSTIHIRSGHDFPAQGRCRCKIGYPRFLKNNAGKGRQPFLCLRPFRLRMTLCCRD